MNDIVVSYEIDGLSVTPFELLSAISDDPAKTSFETYRFSVSIENVVFVDPSVFAVFFYMVVGDVPKFREFTISNIMSGLKMPMMAVVKAILFLFKHNLICENRYKGGRKSYLLTHSGFLIAFDVSDIEMKHDSKWPVGIAVLGDGELKLILPSPCSLVKLEKCD